MNTGNEAAAGRPPPPSPEWYWLSRIPWQLFGTLTFEEARLPEARRLSRFFCVARRAAQLTRTHFRNVPWVLRQEDGDKFGNRHFHFVIAGLRITTDVRWLCAELQDFWERKGGGRCQIEAYDHDRDGIGYLLKKLNHSAANFPTSAKFTDCGGQLMQSRAVHSFLLKSQNNELSREHAAKTSR